MADSTSQGRSLQAIRDTVAAQLAKGMRREDIVKQLMARGWPERSARAFVNSFTQPCSETSDEDTDRNSACRQCLCRALRGLICVVAGFAMLLVGLWMEDVPNGIFHFTGGVLLCVFETHDLLGGLAGWLHNRR